ncbi:hypothetical protein QBC46DRAFT_348513 [Diplogelasinospora grovesii]|uniref:Uncharacterized protein n=1 Tax=Diplogelasinospora grovesii TaxID=303347 RepID=A0AAN6RYV5_9PEZI|nr:hypothetical protein QBC46DRAFT_348513 [Diplogelasinospora grovesii]
MDSMDAGKAVPELHSDLVQKYEKHGESTDKFWRSFDATERAKCMEILGLFFKRLSNMYDKA